MGMKRLEWVSMEEKKTNPGQFIFRRMVSCFIEPTKMQNYLVEEMSNKLAEARQLATMALNEDQRLKKQYEEEQRLAKEWEEKYKISLKHDDEKLAEAALRRKAEHETLASIYRKQLDEQRDEVDSIQSMAGKLNDRVEEIRRKNAERRCEVVQRQIEETIDDINRHIWLSGIQFRIIELLDPFYSSLKTFRLIIKNMRKFAVLISSSPDLESPEKAND